MGFAGARKEAIKDYINVERLYFVIYLPMPKRYVITDIHGCSATFQNLLREQVKPKKDDEIYLLGDYVDRGPDSKGVLDIIFEMQREGYTVKCLRGNHEQFLLDALEDRGFEMHWLDNNGGAEALASFGVDSAHDIPSKYIQFLNDLPYFFELPDCFLVHAGFNFKADRPFEDKEAMLMIRNFPVDHHLIKGKKIIHGHTPTPLHKIKMALGDESTVKVNVDAGCVYKDAPHMGYLLALELNTWQLFVEPCIDPVHG